MKKEKIIKIINKAFHKQIKKDNRIKNAYLMVHSDKNDFSISLAEGKTGDLDANIKQPNYMASVGKLFTSVLIGILYEKGKITFDDKVSKYLDESITHQLHVYKGQDFSNQIRVKHLLNHTSGLSDHFWKILEQSINDNENKKSPREIVNWIKNNTNPLFSPGDGFNYSDTNYHLLGLIIEKITNMPFHQALATYILEPLNMKNTYMLNYSQPLDKCTYPMADFFYNGYKLSELIGYEKIDYSGGSIVSTFDDLLIFMKALVKHHLLTKETLDIMKTDDAKFTLGIRYGYGIWKIHPTPMIMPKHFKSWGVSGATGSFLFYHPKSDSYIIGNFNDFSYQSKGLRYMLLKVLKYITKL
jgi:D-alanyl-D-alanine carboxypeptidase